MRCDAMRCASLRSHLQDKRIMALMGKLMGVDIRAADDHDRARANEPPPQKKPDPPKPVSTLRAHSVTQQSRDLPVAMLCTV